MAIEHPPQNLDGSSQFVSQTTPTQTPTLCNATIPADYVIPIIFIPGIMG